MKIGLIREGKVPQDQRVPLSPKQCQYLLQQYPTVDLVVQPSPIRAFKDEEYRQAGITLQEDLSDRDVLLGVKEVPIDQLLPNKTYFFFSHTYKKQPYNRALLQALLDKKIRLVDYELLREPGGKRLLGFGRYAGIVGAYNGFRAYGLRKGSFHLKPAIDCADRAELENELFKVRLPKDFHIILSGAGKVAAGAKEVLSALKISQVWPDEFLRRDFAQEPVYTQLEVDDYFEREDGKPFTRKEFYADNQGYRSRFMDYAQRADMYLAGHFWAEGSPYIFTREDVRRPDFKIQVVSDISADIDGPVATTLRPSTIADPFYGYDPIKEEVVPFAQEGAIAVSAVDNLPCELPRDASEDFGGDLLKSVLPELMAGDPRGIIDQATETTFEGTLNEPYRYLSDYLAEAD